MRRGVGTSSLATWSWLVAWLALAAAPSAAQPSATYDRFRALDRDGLARLQVMLTYVGESKRGFPTVGFTASGKPVDRSVFQVTYRPGYAYGTGESGRIDCDLSRDEMRAMLDSIGTAADVTAGDVDSMGVYAFAMLDTSAVPPRAFEAIVNETSGLDLVRRMLGALHTNGKACEVLARIACGLHAPTSSADGEVTDRVRVSFAGFALDAATRQVRCVARVTNRSDARIAGPLVMVVVAEPAGARLERPAGFTCGVVRPGAPYIVLAVPEGLAPGAAVERALIFDNPRQVSFELMARVFSGLADR